MPENKGASPNVLLGVGVVMMLVGGIGAKVGTTNLALFVVFVLLFLGGLGTVAASRRKHDRKYD